MRTHSQYRAEAWKICRSRGCIWPFFLTWTVFSLFYGFVANAWQAASKEMGIQTWGMFFQAKAKALLSGLDLTVPSRTIALRMTGATMFEFFIDCIVMGIVAFGLSGVVLRAAKGDMSHWFGRSLEGFKRPLALAWLYCHFTLRVLLAFAVVFLVSLECGALLFGAARFAVMYAGFVLAIFVGIAVFYRYCQIFNLKVENPDWSALRCLRESARMMKGRTWRRFSLDCSYWKPATLWLLGCIAVAVLQFVPGLPPAVQLLQVALAVACSVGFIVLCAYVGVGQALFYLDLKGDAPIQRPRAAARSSFGPMP